MRTITRVGTLVSAVIPTALLSLPARGAILHPGGFANDLGVTKLDRPDLAGTIEAQKLILFTLKDPDGNDFYQGWLANGVIRDPASNELSFFYQFTNDSPSDVLGVAQLTSSSFKDVTTDVVTLTDSNGDIAPLEAIRSDDGQLVVFGFDTVGQRLRPGASSLQFLIRTNATSYNFEGSIGVAAFTAESWQENSPILQFGDTAVSGFAPAGAPDGGVVTVPLPAPLWMGMAGFAGSVIYSLRTKRRR